MKRVVVSLVYATVASVVLLVTESVHLSQSD